MIPNSEPLIIHIILNCKDDLPAECLLVRITGSKRIKQFRMTLDSESHERAIMFALSKGRVMRPNQIDFPIRLTLSEKYSTWHLGY